MNEFLKKLKAALAEKKALSDDQRKQFAEQFETAGKQLGDNEPALQAMHDAMLSAATQLDESITAGTAQSTVKLDFSGLSIPAAGQQLSNDDVAGMIAKQLADAETARQAAAVKLQEDRDANVKLFKDTLEENETIKALAEDDRSTLLSEASDLITADMSAEQVTKLAQHEIKRANDVSVAAKLSGMGYHVQGSPHIYVDESNKVKELQETVDRRLGLLDMSESRRFAKTEGKLQEENKKLAESALALYDAQHGAELAKEHKMLAGGDGLVSDVSVPTSWERTVIREALYQMVGLQFVNSGVENFATSYSIPYSYRDSAAAGRGNTRVYEGGSIPRAGVIQTAETAYNIPQKLAFEVSDELRYLTSGGPLNWNALMENQQNASRIVGEDLEQLLFNELLHAADEYAAVALGSAESLSAQLDGTDNVFVLANFPVVRPRAVYDLQGNQVGSTTNPIVVTYNDGGGADVLSEYDGTGTQPAADYYVIDYNLGEIRIVSEAGALQTPAGTDTLTVQYSYSTNAYNFDTDLGSATADDHWNTYLYRYGLRKAIIEDDRYHMANFGVMSGTHRTQVEQAKQFGANSIRPGTDLMTNGNLGRIKDVANYKTSAPGLWMGDQRAIIGERGVTRLRMTKPWTLGELQDQKDSNGRFTGKKEAYGDQFVVVHTPTQLKRAYTSINLYSTTSRVARAE